jgi:hypothetical protein
MSACIFLGLHWNTPKWVVKFVIGCPVLRIKLMKLKSLAIRRTAVWDEEFDPAASQRSLVA